MKSVFLYREKIDDRDCCAYIDNKPLRFECGHYFGGVILHGSNYSGHRFPEYEDIETILTEAEYNQLKQFGKDISELGYGIKEGDDRYQRGVELCNGIQSVYDKLNSEKNEKFFEMIQMEEREVIMNEFNLSEEDVEKIFNYYDLDYRDRGIVSAIYMDEEKLGYEMVCNCVYLNEDNEFLEQYIAFTQIGKDMLDNDGSYIQLDDGRIVSLAY